MKTQLGFAGSVNMSDAKANDDGAIVLNAVPMRSGDYEYLGLEVWGSEERGYRWDDVLIGHVKDKDVRKILGQFEGLAITDDHWFIPVGERNEYGVGTILQNGKFGKDGYVTTRASIHDPKTILKIQNGSAEELSIGFMSKIVWNENKADGEPDFYITAIELNHVAVVEEGRAGPDARLSHHKSRKPEKPMKTIVINGKSFEVEDAVADDHAQLANANKTLTDTVEAKDVEITDLQNGKAKAEGERDVALAQLQNTKAKLENSAADVEAKAAELANAHSEFLTDLQALGHSTDGLELGKYDRIAKMVEILNSMKVKVADDASEEVVQHVWNTAKTLAPKSTGKSALDDINPDPSVEMSHAQRAEANRNAFFAPTQKEA